MTLSIIISKSVSALRMVFFPQLAIIPLYDLQPLLFMLAASQIILLPIEQIFPVVGVGVEWKFVMDHIVRDGLYIIVLFVVD